MVNFSDEKTFKSDKDGRKILWRKGGARYIRNVTFYHVWTIVAEFLSGIGAGCLRWVPVIWLTA